MGRFALLLCLSLFASAPLVNEAYRHNPKALKAAMKEIAAARLARQANMTDVEREVAAREADNFKKNYTVKKVDGKWQMISTDMEPSDGAALVQNTESNQEVASPAGHRIAAGLRKVAHHRVSGACAVCW